MAWVLVESDSQMHWGYKPSRTLRFVYAESPSDSQDMLGMNEGREEAWVSTWERAPKADLLSGLSVSSIILLSWWDLLSETKGGLVFPCILHRLSQVSQVLHFSSCQHMTFLLPTTVWEKHGTSFHNRTGGSEYWEKGSFLHDFAYWLLAQNGRCTYWMQRSFYSPHSCLSLPFLIGWVARSAQFCMPFKYPLSHCLPCLSIS